MKQKLKKFLLIGVVAIMGAISLMGCNNIQYNAALFDHANELMHIEFLRNNLTQGTHIFFNGDEHEQIDDDSSFPAYRIHIVSNTETFDKIFNQFPPGVNFDNEMLVVYITTNIYIGSPYVIRNLSSSNGTLNIELRRRSGIRIAHAASMPEQRAFVIRMDKQYISEVKVAFR